MMNPRTYEELVSSSKMYELVTDRLHKQSPEEPGQSVENIEMNHELIELILDLYNSDPDSDLFYQKLRKFSLEDIVNYLHASHRYYLTRVVPGIEQSLLHIFSKYGQTHQLLATLALFFNGYKNKLVEHFRMEERHVLPYVKKLIKASKGQLKGEELTDLLANNSIAAFSDHHDEVENELKEVSVIIKSYSGDEPTPLPYRVFINQVELFELDLRKHAIIEDHVLVPMVTELERSLREQL